MFQAYSLQRQTHPYWIASLGIIHNLFYLALQKDKERAEQVRRQNSHFIRDRSPRFVDDLNIHNISISGKFVILFVFHEFVHITICIVVSNPFSLD
mmetsp:Transcript_53201/g.60978  ORF Transcript_53201/g.60978 Transcript_53201/m.60978 type:complete len:96 (+) Transcript_53201:1317-1604(+)